jgi:cell wall-associated NlpC family hydrolase
MALDGMAAVQARIQEIEQIIASRTQAAGAGAPMKATPAETAAQSSDFAALLAQASGNTSGTTPSADAGASGLSGIVSQLSQLTAGGATALGAATGSGQSVARNFLSTAMAQAGKPYIWGASAAPSDPNPKAFDCSELTKWAAARVGVTIPDMASAQYIYLRDHGATMSVDQALHTPGALLFRFPHEPKRVGENPNAEHVAISVGDGVHTIEARGHAYGTNVFDNAAGRGFNFAGMIPGMG